MEKCMRFVGALCCFLSLIAASAQAEIAFKQSPSQVTAFVDQALNLNLVTLLSSTGRGSLNWSLVGAPPPAWATFTGGTVGTLTGTPHLSDVGTSAFTVSVSDGETGAINQIQITVRDVPFWTQNPITIPPVPEETPLSFNFAPLVDFPAGTPLTFTATGLPSWLTLSSSGVLTGTPGRPQVGSYTFTVIVTDQSGDSASATVNGSVTKVIHPPAWTANPLVLPNANDNQPYSQNISGFVTNFEGQPLTFTLLSGPAWLHLSSSGVLSGTPLQSDDGPVFATAQVSEVVDGNTFTATTTLQFNVLHVNRPPVWSGNPIVLPGAMTTVAYSQNISTFASDPDTGETLSFSKISGPAWASVSANGILSGTPTRSDAGLNSIVVQVSDGQLTAQTTFQITLTNPILPPVWSANPIMLPDAPADMIYLQNISSFATGQNGLPLTFTLVSGPSWVSLSSAGVISGTPHNANIGENTLVVSASDGLSSSQVTVLINVLETFHPPVWKQDPISTSTNEEAPFTFNLAPFVTDTDPGVTLTFALVTGPSWASVSAAGVLSGTPPHSSIGLNVLTVSVSDGHGHTVNATVDLTVLAVPHAPTCTANPIALADAMQGKPYSGDLSPFITSEDAGFSFTVAKLTGPAWLAFAANGAVSGTPAASDVGTDLWTFKVTSNNGLSTSCNLQIKVNPPTPPSINPATIDVKERSTLTVNLNSPTYVNNPSGLPLTFSLGGTFSWLTLSPNGTLTLMPTHAQVGTQTVPIVVSDGTNIVQGNITVHVLRDARPPVWTVNPIVFKAFVGQPFSQSIANDAFDLDGVPLTFSKKSGPAWLSVSATGMLTGTPAASDLGQNEFVVTAMNDVLGTDAVVKIIVLSASCSITDGTLDPSWAQAGVAVADDDLFTAITTQTDGKTIAAGTTTRGCDRDHDRDDKGIVVARYNTDGTLDTSFGSGGRVVTSFHHHRNDAQVFGVAVSGSRICITGQVKSCETGDVFVACYTSSGTLDTSFAGNGIFTLDVDDNRSDDAGRGLSFQSDGTIVVAGYTKARKHHCGCDKDDRHDEDRHHDDDRRDRKDYDVLVLRLTAQGVLDSSFGTGGVVITDISESNDYGTSVTLDASGEIVVGGFTNARALDFVNPSSNSDSCNQRKNALVLRYLPNGTLDTSFNGVGYNITDVNGNDDEIYSIAMKGSSIIAAGETEPGSKSHGLVLQYLPNGQRDSSFAAGAGAIVSSWGGDAENFRGVSIQKDSKIVVAGSTRVVVSKDRDGDCDDQGRKPVILVARYLPDGTPDLCFGNMGATIDTGHPKHAATGVALQPTDGKIVVCGNAIVERYLPGAISVPTPTPPPPPPAALSAPVLVSPAQAATGIAVPTFFTWQRSSGPSANIQYELFLCQDSGFTGCSTPVFQGSEGGFVTVQAGVILLALLFALSMAAAMAFGMMHSAPARLFCASLLVVLHLVSCSHRNRDPGGLAGATVNSRPVQVTADQLLPNTVYYWKVIATDDQGHQASSETRSFTTAQ